MRFLRAFAIAVFTGVAGCALAVFVGDYLTRLLHVPDMEGQRGYTIFFVCLPLGIFAGFIIGFVVALWNRRPGFGGYIIAQGLSILVTGIVAGLLVGVLYALSNKLPRIDGKRLTLDFELRVPPTIKIPDQPDGYSIRVNLYLDNKSDDYAFIDWSSITKQPNHITIPGNVKLLTHSKSRSLFASIGNEPANSQFIELKVPPTPRKEDETWSDWTMATQHADLSPVPEPERFTARYRVRPLD